MSEPALSLKNAPIVEAVVDIECDFKPGQSLKAMEAPARESFAKEYPKFRAQHMQELAIKWTGPDSINRSERQGLQAFQFLQEDERQLLQVRNTGYSFNRLAPYGSFDDYLPEIRRTWQLYRQFAAPVQIRTVRLRYINNIPLPFTGDRVDLQDYLQLGTRPPQEDRLRFVGFLHQYVAIDVETGYQVTVVLTTQRQGKGAVPLIFDNGAAASLSADPEDWNALQITLLGLRALKNRVFKNTFTPKCLNLFQ